jgi:CheY-like chemotaxis protein
MPLHRVRVLVIDDDRNTREMLAEVLGMYGAQVQAAESAREAQRTLKSWRPDVIVSDLGMPEVDGFDFMRQLRASPVGTGETTPAIAVSGYARPEDQRLALAAGYQYFLPKPVDLQKLVDAILSVKQTST